MTGFNLPPGCSISDIPGNRPEDEAEEALYDAIYTALDGAIFEEEHPVRIKTLIDKAYADGYAKAISDEAEARYFASQK